MPNKFLLEKNEKILQARKAFINEGVLKREIVGETIANSWLRCRKKGVNAFKPNIKTQLTDKELSKRYEKFEFLLKMAQPFMESLYKIVGNTGFIVRLTDKEGYVLQVGGDTKLLEQHDNINMHKGCNVTEDIIGTNAIGTALVTGQPIQVLAAEHYCSLYHNWTSSACPIKDGKGKTIGVLSMSGIYDKVHPHTLGMVIASAEAIEYELKLDKTNKKLRMANKHFHAIMESISEGLISMDNKGIIKRVNFFARNLLNIKEEEVIGRNINYILDKRNSTKIFKGIELGRGYEEEEIYFKNKSGRKIACIVNVTPIKDIESNKVEGIVITFKEAKVVHNLVNKIVGAVARFTFDDILGESKQIKQAIKLAKVSAKTNATILLLGESGTGKEMFAQAIHNESNRRRNPFVFLNCGAIPRELVASELFGYVEGAFTGAKKGGHPGKFELADGGTIFLDEIGDMPLDTQANLLRVIETKEVVRVGGHDVVPVDVRVIAATHKNLKKEVELGNFRRDLYYRLNVMPIKIPSLTERKEDIRIFIDYFLKKFSRRMGKNIKGINNTFYQGMQKYNWPGNVRELQNVMQLVINTAENNQVLRCEQLPTHMIEVNNVEDANGYDKLLTLEEIEKSAIAKTIQEVSGNMSMASKILGIGRSTLYRKIRKYGLEHVLK